MTPKAIGSNVHQIWELWTKWTLDKHQMQVKMGTAKWNAKELLRLNLYNKKKVWSE